MVGETRGVQTWMYENYGLTPRLDGDRVWGSCVYVVPPEGPGHLPFHN